MRITDKVIGQIALIVVWIGVFLVLSWVTKDEKFNLGCCIMGFLFNTQHLWFE